MRYLVIYLVVLVPLAIALGKYAKYAFGDSEGDPIIGNKPPERFGGKKQ